MTDPDYRRCGYCKQYKSRYDYPAHQWSKRNKPRCNECSGEFKYLSPAKCPKDHPARRILARAIRNSKVKGLECDLTLEDIEPLVVEFCPFLGVKLNYERGSVLDRNIASVDRIDSTRGYVSDNIQIVSLGYNILKSDYSVEVLCTLAENILKEYRGIKPSCPLQPTQSPS